MEWLLFLVVAGLIFLYKIQLETKKVDLKDLETQIYTSKWKTVIQNTSETEFLDDHSGTCNTGVK